MKKSRDNGMGTGTHIVGRSGNLEPNTSVPIVEKLIADPPHIQAYIAVVFTISGRVLPVPSSLTGVVSVHVSLEPDIHRGAKIDFLVLYPSYDS